jgi:hypothetical protein
MLYIMKGDLKIFVNSKQIRIWKEEDDYDNDGD